MVFQIYKTLIRKCKFLCCANKKPNRYVHQYDDIFSSIVQDLWTDERENETNSFATFVEFLESSLHRNSLKIFVVNNSLKCFSSRMNVN